MDKKDIFANVHMTQIVLDLLILIVSFFLAFILAMMLRPHTVYDNHAWLLLVYGTLFLLFMAMFQMYNVGTFNYMDRIVVRTVYSTVLAMLTVTLVVFLLKLTNTSRLILVSFSVLNLILNVGERLLYRRLGTHHNGKGAKVTLFIGSREVYDEFERFLSQTQLRYDFRDVLRPDDERLADMEKFEQYLIQHCIDEVIISVSVVGTYDYATCIKVCEDMGLIVRVVYEGIKTSSNNAYVSSIGTFPMITYHSVSQNQVQIFVKTLVDKVFSALALLILSPVFLVTALAIRLDSPGQAIFRQKRIGLNGKEFEIYKFRSMCADADAMKANLVAQNKIGGGLMFKIEEDPRITRVGAFIRRTSIDELPQLLNVLKGDMSLVGTRPPTPDEVSKYQRAYRRRISIKPGITGLWQVSGRSNIEDFEQVVKFDTTYIDNWSLLMDAKILLKTVGVVLTRKGSY